MIPRRIRQAGGWLFWFIHAPLSAFWVLNALVVVAGTASFVAGRTSFWDVLGAVTVIAGVTRIVARVKGVAAWPTRRAHEELSAHSE